MPNHVACKLRIQGKPSKIKDFFLAVEGKDQVAIDANLLIPYPKKYADQDALAEVHNEQVRKTGKGNFMKDGYNSGGYDWCVENWGTKWGMYSFSDVKYFQKSASVTFQTAWSPPLPLVKKMGEMFPELTFTLRYWECGMGFQGIYQVKGEEILQESSKEYSGSKGG